MALKGKEADAETETKKRKRAGFARIDAGVEANECIKVYLVKSQDEVGATNSFCIDPVDLNQFFGEDGKIYGYKNLKIDIWMSIKSFQAFADITYENTFDSIFGESLLEKEEFLQTFSTEIHCIRSIMSDGEPIRCDLSRESDDASNAHLGVNGSTMEVIRMNLHAMPVGLLYSRLVPLVLLLVEGGSPVDVTDPKWDVYFIVKKTNDLSGVHNMDLLGFATVYRFYHYPDSTRLRVGQILVLPPYQGQGHGRRLLESIYSVAVSENFYDVTFEEPSDYLQYLRACIDTLRLLDFEPIKPAINSAVQYLKENNLSKRTNKSSSKSQFGPPQHVIAVVRQKLKINKKQFMKCWDVLVYLNLDPKNSRCMENFKVSVSDRVKGDILDKDSEANGKRLIEVPNDYDHDMTFVVMWSEAGEETTGALDGDQAAQEEQLKQLVDKQIEDIVKIAQKVYLLRK
ncbi:uncharacterized protein A4U43_C05F26660 [Asparagus officinalis]|uniref:histone acetyltransferase n=1 Tax=Asparagus officinalis TaxID=4686 RepID=A0A5P1EUW4_ASPOF|nr:uncharacterized protein A4U43_C05F26660 [Asparagus officinalis]